MTPLTHTWLRQKALLLRHRDILAFAFTPKTNPATMEIGAGFAVAMFDEMRLLGGRNHVAWQ